MIMNNKNYTKQILELLDSKASHGLTSREIAKTILITEDKKENLKYVRQYLTRLRKRQKIYITYVNEDRERVYRSITWFIELMEKSAFEDPIETEAELKGMKYILELLGYVKKEDLALLGYVKKETLGIGDLTYDDLIDNYYKNNYKRLTKEKYGIGI